MNRTYFSFNFSFSNKTIPGRHRQTAHWLYFFLILYSYCLTTYRLGLGLYGSGLAIFGLCILVLFLTQSVTVRVMELYALISSSV